jgi:hypothetical protein
MIRRCVSQEEGFQILEHCHCGPTGGHLAAANTARKVLEAGFYWPTIFKDAAAFTGSCDACQKAGTISSRDSLPQQVIQSVEIFDIWGIDFMGPFPSSFGMKYIIVAIEYFSKWPEAQALPTNDSRAVCRFLKQIFARFGCPKALISDRGTHFCNSQLQKVLQQYGVQHRVSTAYHPQTNGQAEVTNRGIKRILEKTVGVNRKDWANKLEDALWAFRTAYKTTTGFSPYRLVYGKACHLPVELEHRAYWAVQKCNLNENLTKEHRILQLNELDEWRLKAYENSHQFKMTSKLRHDRRLRAQKNFEPGDKVLLYNSRFKFFPGKLRSCWSGPFTITEVSPFGACDIMDSDGIIQKVNGQRLKIYKEPFDSSEQIVDFTE